MKTELNTFADTTWQPSQATWYELIGGADKLRALVDRFYGLMDMEPQFAVIRALHPTTLEGSRDKFYWFLSGWIGVPDLYIKCFGRPRFRPRHLPYVIASPECVQWLRCVAMAMHEFSMGEWLQERLLISFFQTPGWMCNKPDVQS